ncbi:MAG: hypothetical protein NT049_16385, partial [Planctomycetota bacterium]|nr:hypothetical protein [Planctomycetota bacterium]
MKSRTVAFVAIGCAVVALIAVVLVLVGAGLLWFLWETPREYKSVPQPSAVMPLPPNEPQPTPPSLTPVPLREPEPSPEPPLPPPKPFVPPAPPPKEPHAAAALAPVDAGNWTTHADKLGFTVQHPAGWTIEATGDGAIVIRSP